MKVSQPMKLLPVFLALVPLASAQQTKPAFWIDPATKKMWTISDNGYGLSWSQAKRYCRESSIGGFTDWTLPSINELQGLFGGPEDATGHHVKGALKLTGWEWSATPGNQNGEGWTLDFGDGARASVAAGDSGLNRAVCVRAASPI
jgi:hypothetical protein